MTSHTIDLKLQGNNKFIVGGEKFGCAIKNKTQNVVRRVVDTEVQRRSRRRRTKKERKKKERRAEGRESLGRNSE